MRFATVLVFLLTASLAIGGVLLIPSYVVSERAADASERYLLALEETIGVRERAGVTEDVRALNERLRILESYASEPSSKPFFEDVLFDLSPNIIVSGLGFKKGESALSVSIVGQAATRAALLAFVERLRASGKFEGVTIPVTQLAQDADIPFSVTATYRSTP